MRLKVAALCLLGIAGATPVFGQDLRDTFLDVAKRELGSARMAEPPSAGGTRSAIGPQLYRLVVDSVVLVVTKDAIGTGVLVSPQGHILTNWHVAKDNEVVGVVPRNRELLKGLTELRKENVSLARVLALDPRRDLALLYVTPVPVSLKVAPLGKPGSVEVGQDVYSIGHPEGLLWSYAEGVVSQIRPDYQWVYKDGSTHQATVLQTQTPMYPGNSGGALFDGGRQVVGILYGGKEATLGFAIAVNEVYDWIQSLVRK
jgi:S1-C subfamily serine protease